MSSAGYPFRCRWCGQLVTLAATLAKAVGRVDCPACFGYPCQPNPPPIDIAPRKQRRKWRR